MLSHFILLLYGLIHIIILPLYCFYLCVRWKRGKETWRSIVQRFALSPAWAPKKGDKIWLHAASIGEANLALTFVGLINNQHLDKYSFLITTGTVSSGEIIIKKMPANCRHQFQPIDNPVFVLFFLLYHRPKLGIFVEEEFWPCLINMASLFCPLMLINGRMSDKSFIKWQKYSLIFRLLAGNFRHILVQSKKDLEKYKKLGCLNAKNLGNLKFAAEKIIYNKNEAQELAQSMEGKFVVVAASTHREDELALLDFAKQIDSQKALLIIVLRHPDRAHEVGCFFKKEGVVCSARSAKKTPDSQDQIYIADKFGELGMFYDLCDIAFIGGSFGDLGGHNLLEAAHFAKPIIVGPDMGNFQNITNEMIEQGALLQVDSDKSLTKQILSLQLSANNATFKKYGDCASKYVVAKNKISQLYLEELNNILESR